MPTIEIMSPLSDTCVPTTFWVDGEDDLPRAEKKETKKKSGLPPPQIKLQHREHLTPTYSGDHAVTLLEDGTWTCELTLTAGLKYDIKATLWIDGMATNETDEVFGIQVSTIPLITIDPIPADGLFAAAPPAKEFTGTSAAAVPGVISCALLRLSMKKGLALPVAKYVNTGRSPSSGNWFVNPPPKRMRPKGNQKTLVLIAALDNAAGEAVASCSRVVRKA